MSMYNEKTLKKMRRQMQKANDLLAAHQHAQALEAFDRYIKRFPKAPNLDDINARRIRIAERINELDKASQILRTLSDNQSKDIYLASLPVHYRLGNYNQLISNAEYLLANEELSAKNYSEIYFYLAFTEDKRGRYKEAFKYFQLANSYASKLEKNQRLDGDSTLHYMAFLEDNLGLITQETSDFEDEPIFVVGFVRSGTTLIRTILDCHPQMAVVDEKQTIGLNHRPIAANPEGFAEFLANFPEYQKVRRLYWENVSKYVSLDTPFIIDKHPLKAIDTPFLYKIFPKAKFVFIVRHPKDCVLSAFMQDFEANDYLANTFTFENTVEFYDRFMELWQACVENLNLNVYYVYYEDLIDDLEGELDKLCQFLGTELDESMLRYYEQRFNIHTPSYSQVIQKPHKGAQHRFERYQIEEPILEAWSKYWGYTKL